MALDPLTAGIDLASKAIDKLWPDAAEADRQRIATIVTLTTAQLQVNQAEAASPSLFVAGWRPAIGWVCGSALAYTYLLYPLLTWACAAWAPHLVPPKLGNDGMLYELLLGMLGLGGMRTFEKIKGVA